MRSLHTATLAVALLATVGSPMFGQADNQHPGGETVLLDFTADWCGYCRQMTPIVDALGQAGHPVRRVDVDREPELAARYRATSLPCFVMVAGGREVDRVVGATSRERLLAMLAQARQAPSPQDAAPSRSSPAGVPATFAQVSGPTKLSGPTKPPVAQLPATQSPATQMPATQMPATQMPATQMPVQKSRQPFRPTADPSASPRQSRQLASASGAQTFAPQTQAVLGHEPSNAAAPVAARSSTASPPLVSAAAGVDVAAVPRSVVQRALAASVRLKVEDSDGRSWGSGTIVDVKDGRALVVTCAHIFRESGGNTPVSIDLYGDDTPKGLTGKVVSYDLSSDVALLEFDAPAGVSYLSVAPTAHVSSSSDPVVSVGCGHGTMPTAIVSRVVSIDRFLGPPNLQVAGQPVQGRSGGGLFSADGHMIGVCNAADPQDDQGLYAALGAIHAQLDRSQLSYVYAPRPERADMLLASTGSSDRNMLPAMPERRRDPTDGGPVNTAARGATNPAAPGATNPAASAPQRTPAPAASVQPQAVQPQAAQSPAAQSPAAQSPAAQPAAGLAPVTLPSRRPAAAAPLPTAPSTPLASSQPAGLSPAERGALDAIGWAGDDAEVIVIVRSRSNPTAKSQIIVLDHASPTLLNHLSSARSGTPPRPAAPQQPPTSQPARPGPPTHQLAAPPQPAVARR